MTGFSTRSYGVRGVLSSEIYEDACVDEPSCEVVGHGILLTADVSNPEIAGDIVDADDVEAVQAQPHVAQVAPETVAMAVLVVQQAVHHANINTTIGRRTKDIALQTRMWRTEGQSVGKSHL